MSLILDPPLAAVALLTAGEKKSHLALQKMVILGTLAGFFVAFGNQIAAVVSTSGTIDPDPLSGPQKYLAGIAFSVALIFIMVAGGELFTGNCLIIMAVLAEKVTLGEMLFDWFVIYFSNFLGTIIAAAIIFGGDTNGGYDFSNVTAGDKLTATSGWTVCKTAIAKANLSPHAMFFRAIPANMIVCLAVIMGTASKSASGKVLVVAPAIAAFAAAGYEHSIANMYTFSLATMLNCPVSSHGYYWLNLVLSSIGNIVGASILAFSYYAVYLMPTESPHEMLHVEPVAARFFDFAAGAIFSPRKERTKKQEEMLKEPVTELVPPDSLVVAPGSVCVNATATVQQADAATNA